MAELLGVVSGAAGLLSLGITMCQGILTYYNAFRDSRDDIDKMCASVEDIGRILLAVHSTLSQGRFNKQIIAMVDENIRCCKEGLDVFAKKLDKIRARNPDGTVKTQLENAKRKVFYPFKESTLVKLREVCDDLKDNLGLVLDVLNIDASIISQQHIDTVLQLSASMSNDVKQVATDIRLMKLQQEATIMTDIYAWLTPLTIGFQNRHRESLSTKVRQDEGARQLLELPHFKEWKSSMGMLLWCSGLRKTINASYIIEQLRQEYRNCDVGIAYIYFSYKDIEIQTPVNIMASILQQLVSRGPFSEDLQDLYAHHTKENTRPSAGDIVELLQSVVHSFSKVFVIVDALDECSDTDDVRSTWITELRKLQHRMSILVTSRPIPDLEELLKDSIRITIEASSTDIRNYLQQRIESTSSMKKHLADEPALRETIISLILQKVKGMFLMARLYLDTLINKTTRRKIKNALETLPEGLDSIYEELMVRIELQNPRDHADLAIKVLGWIFYAARPLTVIEVQHALAIEQGDNYLDQDGIPSRDLLVSVCAGLVIINKNSNTISLVHYTTQEYFQRGGKRLLHDANKEIASACLTYLHFDVFDCQIEDLENQEFFLDLLRDYPLLSYAAQHWGDHLREACDDEANQRAVELLEYDAKVHLITWVKDYTDNLAKRTYFRPRTKVLGLALASSFGLTSVASDLIESGSSVHDRDSNGQTALHRATENEHADTAALLLKLGAEVNFRDVAGWSPLHKASAQADDVMAKLLIENGADIDLVDGYSATPLYRAAEAGAEKVVRLLLSKNANIDARNTYLQTALHRAADKGNYPIVHLLLKHGADTKAKDHYGYTPFYRAADQGHETVARLLRTHFLKS
ncbi:uncharacterized protein GGS22DRAFT_188212 [Annulohypoxylon maeteangense]|uniref:uncharacterized protein n=1 Tax=Annulohypoxylon maeteangense TaxID=1927788 RepID=UPI0020073379|nr:uncharacterized protein GGS22DRAFT_188212 [Annulohypoxylon maeteangense]KAI0885923.1 hypothetical protein GGS22DRAFT_188212 [Annulohypoxylon maeteangense]